MMNYIPVLSLLFDFVYIFTIYFDMHFYGSIEFLPRASVNKFNKG